MKVKRKIKKDEKTPWKRILGLSANKLSH